MRKQPRMKIGTHEIDVTKFVESVSDSISRQPPGGGAAEREMIESWFGYTPIVLMDVSYVADELCPDQARELLERVVDRLAKRFDNISAGKASPSSPEDWTAPSWRADLVSIKKIS